MRGGRLIKTGGFVKEPIVEIFMKQGCCDGGGAFVAKPRRRRQNRTSQGVNVRHNRNAYILFVVPLELQYLETVIPDAAVS